MTPAKTVREQVERIVAVWTERLAEYESLIGPDGLGPAGAMTKAEDRLSDIRFNASSVFLEHATLFAAAEETKAENERLREAIDHVLGMQKVKRYDGYELVPDFNYNECLSICQGILRAALNPGGSE